jgi:LacI family transcriptional regulator
LGGFHAVISILIGIFNLPDNNTVMGKITLKTLAAKLKLSMSTVSKALNDSHEISGETKRKVRLMANKMHFVPNPYASSLRKKISKTIAIVIPEVSDSFFAQAINGIESVLQDKGYHVLIYLTHEKFRKEKSIIQEIQNGRIDGVLMSVSAETTGYLHLKELWENEVPLVFFDRVSETIETARITTNDYESGYKATKHLIDCGCKRISFLTISNNLLITRQRLKGYKQALADGNMTFRNADVLICKNDPDENRENIRKLLSKRNRPDGIVSSVEKLAPDVYQVCRGLGISIPGQLKLVCFSNVQSASLFNPSLTTITQPAFQMGEEAATVLLRALKKGTTYLKNENRVIPSVLMVRDSTMPVDAAFRGEPV